ncbi:MAG TPA: HAD-IIIC family phosphatase [Patescibacteria group bacterium]|nr:HAD-IIIC family phosphatase [Patescibacteria group bacterium]
MSVADPGKVWRKFKSGGGASPDITVGIAASVTAEPIESYLGAYLLGRGFKHPRLTFGPFNQLPQVCRNHVQAFGDTPDAIVLLWRTEDLFADLLAEPDKALAAVNDLGDALSILRRNFSGTIIVSAPPYPTVPDFDVRQIDQTFMGAALSSRIRDLWMSRVASIERVRMIDLQALQTQAGIDASFDPRKWYLYRQPWTEPFWDSVGTQIGRLVAAERLSAKKCIVLDADNTLWGGIIGEDGIEGIALGNEFPGSAYRDFQKYLLHLQRRGVLLAVASKNNPADFYDVMDRHDAMVLRREHFAALEIHWDSKIESIRRVAKDLNIGLDSIVFVDDSPKEIGEVQERLPDVTCVLVPEETAELPYCLAGTDYFDLPEITEEDKRRTEMIRADRSRKELHETMSEEEFKAALGLEMTLFRVDKQHLARITQLVNKTNQFNLTTIRRSADEIEALMRSPNHMVLGMELRDKYGDYGLVGVSILERAKENCVIDTMLMSCRVLGRDAETAFIAQVAKVAGGWKCKTIEGRYVPTAKNAMVKDLYPAHGFEKAANDGVWVARPENITKSPPHAKVKVVL